MIRIRFRRTSLSRATPLAAGLVTASLLVASCGAELPPSAGPGVVLRTESPDSLGTGPATSQTATPGDQTTVGTPTGAADPYSLLIHCGIKYAIWSGKNWVAEASPAPVATVTTDPATGVTTSRNFLRGTMSRVSPTEAIFTSTEDPLGLTVRFRILETSVPPCA